MFSCRGLVTTNLSKGNGLAAQSVKALLVAPSGAGDEFGLEQPFAQVETYLLGYSPRAVKGLGYAVTTLVLLLLNASHPPAGATTLIVSLGLLHTLPQLFTAAAAVVEAGKVRSNPIRRPCISLRAAARASRPAARRLRRP